MKSTRLCQGRSTLWSGLKVRLSNRSQLHHAYRCRRYVLLEQAKIVTIGEFACSVLCGRRFCLSPTN